MCASSRCPVQTTSPKPSGGSAPSWRHIAKARERPRLVGVSRRLANLTLDNLADLSPGCRSCVFWELDPPAGRQACAGGAAELEKEAWVSDTLLEWGCCGQLVYVDGTVAGHVLYAPPAYVPRSMAFATSPV